MKNRVLSLTAFVVILASLFGMSSCSSGVLSFGNATLVLNISAPYAEADASRAMLSSSGSFYVRLIRADGSGSLFGPLQTSSGTLTISNIEPGSYTDIAFLHSSSAIDLGTALPEWIIDYLPSVETPTEPAEGTETQTEVVYDNTILAGFISGPLMGGEHAFVEEVLSAVFDGRASLGWSGAKNLSSGDNTLGTVYLKPLCGETTKTYINAYSTGISIEAGATLPRFYQLENGASDGSGFIGDSNWQLSVSTLAIGGGTLGTKLFKSTGSEYYKSGNDSTSKLPYWNNDSQGPLYLLVYSDDGATAGFVYISFKDVSPVTEPEYASATIQTHLFEGGQLWMSLLSAENTEPVVLGPYAIDATNIVTVTDIPAGTWSSVLLLYTPSDLSTEAFVYTNSNDIIVEATLEGLLSQTLTFSGIENSVLAQCLDGRAAFALAGNLKMAAGAAQELTMEYWPLCYEPLLVDINAVTPVLVTVEAKKTPRYIQLASSAGLFAEGGSLYASIEYEVTGDVSLYSVTRSAAEGWREPVLASLASEILSTSLEIPPSDTVYIRVEAAAGVFASLGFSASPPSASLSTITVSFAENGDPVINGMLGTEGVISSAEYSTSYTISAPTGYASYQWFINSTPIEGELGASFAFTATNHAELLRIGNNSITLIVTDAAGGTYSAVLNFQLEE